MRVKRFTAPDMAQAMRQVRQALGADAVILSANRQPDGGVEISAAVDPEPGLAAEARPRAPRRAMVETKDEPPEPDQPDDSPGLAQLARQVESLGNQLSRHLLATEAAAGFVTRPEVAPIFSHLSGQEVDAAILRDLIDELASPHGQGLWPRLAIRLKKLMAVTKPPKLGKGGPLIWALVGPTGVGKTTTIAKLAAQFAIRRGARVGLVTVDTYRIAAAEQLKVYGQIMDLPIAVAATPEEYAQALASLAGVDLILVDTVGRSPGDSDNLDELKEVLSRDERTMAHLVLACPIRDTDQTRVVRSFSRFNPKSLVFTKLDETNTYGPILNQVVRTGLPVSYLATGQRVPDDLEEATREELTRLLLPSRSGQRVA